MLQESIEKLVNDENINPAALDLNNAKWNDDNFSLRYHTNTCQRLVYLTLAK